MKLAKVFVLASAMLSLVYSFGQTANDIISKSIDAAGGKNRIGKIINKVEINKEIDPKIFDMPK